MILYHGSPSDFNRFDDTITYFTPSFDAAKTFGDIVYTCKLTAKKIFELDAGGNSWACIDASNFLKPDDYEKFKRFVLSSFLESERAGEEECFDNEGASINFVSEFLFDMGYDMVIARDVLEDDTGYYYTDEVVVKSSEQITIVEKEHVIEQEHEL